MWINQRHRNNTVWIIKNSTIKHYSKWSKSLKINIPSHLCDHGNHMTNCAKLWSYLSYIHFDWVCACVSSSTCFSAIREFVDKRSLCKVKAIITYRLNVIFTAFIQQTLWFKSILKKLSRNWKLVKRKKKTPRPRHCMTSHRKTGMGVCVCACVRQFSLVGRQYSVCNIHSFQLWIISFNNDPNVYIRYRC